MKKYIVSIEEYKETKKTEDIEGLKYNGSTPNLFLAFLVLLLAIFRLDTSYIDLK